MKTFKSVKILVTPIITIFSFLFNQCMAQPCLLPGDCPTFPGGVYKKLPEMWVPKEAGIKRTKQYSRPALFSASKAKRVRRNFEEQKKSFFYDIKEFQDMVQKISAVPDCKKIRIYFGIYNKECPAGFDLEDTRWVFIFAANNNNGNDLGVYYYFNPKKSGKLTSLTKEGKECMVTNYLTAMADLRKTIKKYKGLPENKIGDDYTDTRSIVYNIEDFCDAFICEVKYQEDKNRITTTGVQLNLSAYSRKGKAPTAVDGFLHKKRLIIQFEYLHEVDGHNVVYYIDDQTDFEHRDKPSRYSEVNFVAKRAADNGQLCPANCPK